MSKGSVRLQNLENSGYAFDFRLDKLVTMRRKKVRNLVRTGDRPYGEDRRYVALNGLRLASDLLRVRNGKQLYTGKHFVRDTIGNVWAAAEALSVGTADDVRNGRVPASIIGGTALVELEAQLPPGANRFAPDARATGLIVELNPDWQCSGDGTDPFKSDCIEALNLVEALTTQSYTRLTGILDLHTAYVPPAV